MRGEPPLVYPNYRTLIVRSVVLPPILLFAFVVASTLYSREPDVGIGITERVQLLMLVLTSALRAIVQGRFPTLTEKIIQFDMGESVLSVLLCWVVATLTIVAVLWIASRFKWRHSWWIGMSVMLALVTIAWIAEPSLHSLWEKPTITIEVNTHLGALTAHQGFSQGGESEMMQAGVIEAAMQQLATVNPRYVRIDHLFDYYNVLTLAADGAPQYEWSELDRVVDAIRSAGAEPLMCLSYLPLALAPNTRYGAPASERDWQTWGDLVYQTVLHFNVEHKLNIRYWEVWNEPNLSNFWSGTLEDYLRLYKITVQAAKRADPSILIGGPATSSLRREVSFAAPMAEEQWIRGLVRFTQDNQLPLAFLSWHYYDSDPHNLAWSVEQHQAWLDGLKVPLLITEWSSSGSYSPIYDSEWQAAYLAAGFTILADSPVTQSFLFEPFDGGTSQNPQGRWGILHVDGTPKPSFKALELASQLDGDRLQVRSASSTVGALAAQDGSTIRVLLWSLDDTNSINLTLSGLKAGQSYQIGGEDQELVTASGTLTVNVPITYLRLLEIHVAD